MNTADIIATLKQVKYDLSVTQTRVDEALRAVSQFPSTPLAELVCKTCGVPWKSRYQLEEHVYNSHNGPVPSHIIAAEALAEAGFIDVMSMAPQVFRSRTADVLRDSLKLPKLKDVDAEDRSVQGRTL